MITMKRLFLQIEQNRKGKELTLDLKIGILHAFPNGELQFENVDQNDDIPDNEVRDINERRRVARRLKARKDEEITEKNLENLARAMS